MRHKEENIFHCQLTQTKRLTLNTNHVIKILEYSNAFNEYINLGEFRSSDCVQIIPFSDECFIINTLTELNVVNISPPFNSINKIYHNLKKITLVAKISEDKIVQVYNNIIFMFWNIKTGVLEGKTQYNFDRMLISIKKKSKALQEKKENSKIRSLVIKNDCNRPFSIAVNNRKLLVSYSSKIVIFNLDINQVECIIKTGKLYQLYFHSNEYEDRIIYKSSGNALYSMNIRTYLIEKETETLDSKNANEQLSHFGNVLMQGLIYKKNK